MANSKQGQNKTWLIILAIVGIGALWLINTFNSLVKLNESVDNSWAQVANNLQRRSDLIPNLVETVKGYAKHEEGVFTQIADARAKLAGGNMSVTETAQANEQLTGALGRLLMVAEAYPELKANENFIKLQDELAGSENRLATSRKDYNETVKVYNVKIKTFPNNLVAGMMGYSNRDYFEVSAAASENVKVDFSK